MNIKEKKEIYEVFAECFHEIVVPILERMEAKIENTATKEDISKIDRKLVQHEDRMDRQGKDIEKLKAKLAD